MKLKKGDKVKTIKGSRMSSPRSIGTMTIVEANKKWRNFSAYVCEKRDHTKKLFLAHNLVKA